MKKLFAIVLFLAAVSVLGWLVWFRPVKVEEEEKKPEALVPVHVGHISRADLKAFCTAYGTIEPEPQASARLAVGVPGVISAVHCVEGQSVQLGDLLFEIDSRATELAVQFAQKTLDRQKKLAETDGTSLKALQDAEQQWSAARAQLALLQIRSPISGTVNRLNLKVGEAADLNSVLAEIVDLHRLVASLTVTAEDLGSLKSGQAVEVIPTDSTNRWLTALNFTGAQIDPKTGAGLVRAPLPTNSDWHPGLFVKARIVKEERTQRLVVPVASVAKDPTGTTYIALVEGEKAVLKPVRTGLRDGDLIEIEGEGVEADKAVVTEGAYGLIMNQQFATRIQVVDD